jgi:hypothetical protein
LSSSELASSVAERLTAEAPGTINVSLLEGRRGGSGRAGGSSSSELKVRSIGSSDVPKGAGVSSRADDGGLFGGRKRAASGTSLPSSSLSRMKTSTSSALPLPLASPAGDDRSETAADAGLEAACAWSQAGSPYFLSAVCHCALGSTTTSSTLEGTVLRIAPVKLQEPEEIRVDQR